MTVNFSDQAALNFVVGQLSHIEATAYKVKRPMIRYRDRIFVDTAPNPFAPSVTFFSQDEVGKADFINGKADDIKLIDLTQIKAEQGIYMSAAGYSFSIEEIGQAQLAGQSLTADGATAVVNAFERLVDELVHVGNTKLGQLGLTNMSGISSSAAAATFAAGTVQQAMDAINGAISAVWTGSNGVELPDTILLPIAAIDTLASRRIDATSEVTLLAWLKQNNLYTQYTGQALKIEGTHHLTTKMVVYRNSPEVLKMYMPMPVRFLPPQPRGINIFVPAMSRVSPVNIRVPAAIRYVTGVA